MVAELEVMLLAATAVITGGVAAAEVVNVKSPLVACRLEEFVDFTW